MMQKGTIIKNNTRKEFYDKYEYISVSIYINMPTMYLK